ncbi:hypothetical protein [Thiobacillus sp.]
MKNIFVMSLAAVLSMVASLACSQDFPEAPPRIKEAETLGLLRVSTDELRNLLQGPLLFFGESYTGQKSRSLLVFSPDGIHYFDYDVSKGFDAHVWRRAMEK